MLLNKSPGSIPLEASPAPPGTPDPVYYGSNGLDVAGLNAEGCYGYVDISWNPINDTLIRDFQGFRVLRREGPSWIGGTDETELTGADAAWLTTFRDATVEEGKSYSYRIMATDCYFEQHRGKAPADWPEAGNDPADNYGEAFASNVSIGRPLLDPARPQVVTGLLGLEPPWFLHNPVSFWIRNASDAPLTLLALGASWENPEAYLEACRDPVRETIELIRHYDVSQLPVLQDGHNVGAVNEAHVLRQALENTALLDRPVTEVMDPPLPEIAATETAAEAKRFLLQREGGAALVRDGDRLVGILTRIDLIDLIL